MKEGRERKHFPYNDANITVEEKCDASTEADFTSTASSHLFITGEKSQLTVVMTLLTLVCVGGCTELAICVCVCVRMCGHMSRCEYMYVCMNVRVCIYMCMVVS